MDLLLHHVSNCWLMNSRPWSAMMVWGAPRRGIQWVVRNRTTDSVDLSGIKDASWYLETLSVACMTGYTCLNASSTIKISTCNWAPTSFTEGRVAGRRARGARRSLQMLQVRCFAAKTASLGAPQSTKARASLLPDRWPVLTCNRCTAARMPEGIFMLSISGATTASSSLDKGSAATSGRATCSSSAASVSCASKSDISWSNCFMKPETTNLEKSEV